MLLNQMKTDKNKNRRKTETQKKSKKNAQAIHNDKITFKTKPTLPHYASISSFRKS
jgi:hypothetical protein